MWQLYALLSAIFAALTSIFAKIGMNDMNSNLGTALRTVVVLGMSWMVVFVTGAQSGFGNLTRTNYIFIILSGLATGVSWLFYFYALRLGDVSRVAPIDKLSIVFTLIFAFIFLGEAINLKTVVGILLITAGTLLLIK